MNNWSQSDLAHKPIPENDYLYENDYRQAPMHPPLTALKKLTLETIGKLHYKDL